MASKKITIENNVIFGGPKFLLKVFIFHRRDKPLKTMLLSEEPAENRPNFQ
jgi:hypothetical protein